MSAAALPGAIEPEVAITVAAGEWPPEQRLEAIASAAAAAVLRRVPDHGGTGSELSLLFTDDAAVQALNRRWRGKDRPTNVLSFPQPTGPLLGDIVLASETVNAEASLARKTPEEHIAHLIVHGLLHLLGYDHEDETEADAMEGLEAAALAEMGIADPYAAARQDR